jgi:GWxTD domain-containing protein
MWLIDSHHPLYRWSMSSLLRENILSKSLMPHRCRVGLKQRLLHLFLFGLGAVVSVPAAAVAQATPDYTRQPAMVDFDQTVGVPPYIFRAYQFAADVPGQMRVEVYIGLVNDMLQFVKASSDSSDNGYRAQYEVNVTVWDKKNNMVDSRNWKRELTANSFDATNDRKKLNLERAAFDLPPGEYEIAMEITDRDTGKNLRERRPLKLAPFDDQLRFSSIVFTEPFAAGAQAEPNSSPGAAEAFARWKNLPRSARRDSLRYNLTGILTNRLHPNQTLPNGVSETREVSPGAEIGPGAYFEIYGAAAGETLQLQGEIRDWRQQVEQAWEETITVSPAQNALGLSHFTNLAEKLGQPGLHTLRLVAKSASKKEATAEASFQVQVSADQDYTARLAENKAMLYEPLRYVVKGADYKRMAEADEAARDSLVAEFWRQRDPEPDTPANKLREEFYRRVAFADMRFAAAGAGKSGWETDRGRIYIKYGPPKEVHHQMAEQGSPPYEIWFYPDLDLYFVFRDKTGSGDFELVNR